MLSIVCMCVALPLLLLRCFELPVHGAPAGGPKNTRALTLIFRPMEAIARLFGELPTKAGEPLHLSAHFETVGREIEAGEELHPAQAAVHPRVTWADPGKAYTLVMLDPDAPAPEDPSKAPWLHWLVTNATNGTAATGTTAVHYTGPTPPHGLHRYYILALEQPGPGGISVSAPAHRNNFNLAALMRDHHLTLAGAAMFTARPEGPRHHGSAHPGHH